MQGVADAIFKDELEAVREYAYKPFSVTAHAKTGCITLEWEGQEDTYSVRWKKKGDSEYNYRQVTGRTSDFNGLENYQPYLFSVAGTYNGTVSEYTQEITAEPVDWATDPNNPDNAVNKAIAARTPKYLGVVETVPANKTAVITKGERLGAVDANAGDWVLSGKTVGGWKVGVCYRWTGGKWEPLTPEKNYGEHYHACILHICEIEELMQKTGHFGALFAKALVTQKALIDDLAANQAFIKQLIVQRLKIDSDRNSDKDFEAWFDETNGLKIKNKGQEIFRVTPDGDAIFSGEINCNGFQVLNTNTSSGLGKKLFEWEKGDHGIKCAEIILGKTITIEMLRIPEHEKKVGDIWHYYHDKPLIKKYFGKGLYGNREIFCVKLCMWITSWVAARNARLELLDNTGGVVDTISAAKGYDHEGIYDNNNKITVRYKESQYDFAFYETIQSQKVIMPELGYIVPDIPNTIYRDENGFIKIS